MNVHQFAKVRIVVGPEGGAIRVIDADGEEVFELGFMPGCYEGLKYLDLMQETDTVEVSQGVTLIQPRMGRVKRQTFGDAAFKSGANPDYTPTVMTEAEKRMQKMLQEVRERTSTVEKRERTIRRMMEQRAATQHDEEQVVETEENTQEQQRREAETPPDQTDNETEAERE